MCICWRCATCTRPPSSHVHVHVHVHLHVCAWVRVRVQALRHLHDLRHEVVLSKQREAELQARYDNVCEQLRYEKERFELALGSEPGMRELYERYCDLERSEAETRGRLISRVAAVEEERLLNEQRKDELS